MGFVNGPGKFKNGPCVVHASDSFQVVENQYLVHAVHVVHVKSNFLKTVNKSRVSYWVRQRKRYYFWEFKNAWTAWTAWTVIDIQWIKKMLSWTRTWTTRTFAWTAR